jgi:hypothetical protein
MAYSKVKALMQCANTPSSCAPQGGGTTPGETVVVDVNAEQVARQQTKTYSITVPAGTTRLEVKLTATSGDPDLKVVVGQKTCSAAAVGSDKCTINSPTAGPGKVEVYGYSAAVYGLRGVASTGSVTPTTNICTDHCGGEVNLGGGTTCWCDEACSQMSYADCCQSDAGAQGTGRAYITAGCGN